MLRDLSVLCPAGEARFRNGDVVLYGDKQRPARMTVSGGKVTSPEAPQPLHSVLRRSSAVQLVEAAINAPGGPWERAGSAPSGSCALTFTAIVRSLLSQEPSSSALLAVDSLNAEAEGLIRG
jgi:hypothetical protein